jgi:flavin reductase (DIM6/NTAB) family NADH-FMN oxidoreductase RutF
VELIPAGSFVLTASYAETRGGVIARWVQRVSSSPHLVVVAIEKGQPLSPVIRDSRRFGLCQLAPEDRVLMRIFDADRPDAPKQPSGVRAELIDPFLGLATRTTATGVPILAKSMAWIECELTRHLDVEGNCELYIGLVQDGGVLRAPESLSTELPAPSMSGPTAANLHPHAAPKLPVTTTPKPRPSRRRAR